MKTAIVFASLTGNTEAMAEVLAGELNGKAEAYVFDVSAQSFDNPDAYDTIAFGSPAMGEEVLEEDSFEPMFSAIESSLKGKRVALFGSYGWGDGQWMRDWEDRCAADGAIVVGTVIAMGAPDDEAVSRLKELASAMLK